MSNFTPGQRRLVFRQLMDGFRTAPSTEPEARWAWLEAAHVVGQRSFGLHWESHTAMLRFALQTQNLSEATGQLLRLALVPLGHLLQRLPAGNSGRATVSAFAPMPVHERTMRLIRQAATAAESPSF